MSVESCRIQSRWPVCSILAAAVLLAIGCGVSSCKSESEPHLTEHIQVSQKPSHSSRLRQAPESSTRTSWIAAVRKQGSSSSLWAFTADGRNITQLTSEKETAWWAMPSWAPRGNCLAAAFYSDTEGHTLRVIDWPQKSVRVVAAISSSFGGCAISPDGTSLVWCDEQDQKPAIGLLSLADPSVKRRVDTKGHHLTHPAWHPDGTTIAYLGVRRGDLGASDYVTTRQIWTMTVSGEDPGDPCLLSLDRRVDYDGPSWSLDGLEIAALAKPAMEGRHSKRYLERIDVATRHSIQKHLPPRDWEFDVGSPVWVSSGMEVGCPISTLDGTEHAIAFYSRSGSNQPRLLRLGEIRMHSLSSAQLSEGESSNRVNR